MKMLIAGERVAGDEVIEVTNPFDGSLIDTVPAATADDVERALQAALRARPVMKRMPLHQRSSILNKTATLLEQRQDLFTDTLAREVGKTIAEARAEMGRAIDTFRLAAEDARRICGSTVPFSAAPNGAGKSGYYVREPVGVIVAITPFNFPVNLAAHKLAPAIAAGNPVILKPASATPLADVMLGETLLEAGLPPEAIAVLTGAGSKLGDALVGDDRVRLVTFTGSAEVGKTIMSAAGLKYSIMELGSNSPVIVMPDADLAFAARRITVGGYAIAGQVCISVQRVLVHEEVHDRFVETLVARVAEIRVGDPLDPETGMGPLIDEDAARDAETLAEEAVEQGAAALLPIARRGAIMSPTVLGGVTPSMRAFQEEAFAPFVTVTPFGSLEEGIALANDSRYGLQAGVFTQDVNAALEAAEELETGGVMINEVPTFRVDLMPYGGVKDSGLGREGLTHAIEAMTEIKLICFNR
jgi:glyceraldehyde-3-phosphate dehydrogenase (NADP+)